VHNGEGLQVLRYENTQKYEPHWVSESVERGVVGLVALGRGQALLLSRCCFVLCRSFS